MRQQPNRLPAGTALSGTAIDRGRSLSFRLNGEEISGYAGDTVLSATLACGVMTVGTFRGSPLALDEWFCPPVAPVGQPDAGMPMSRLPVTDGADLVTLGARRRMPAPNDPIDRFRRFVAGPHRTLGHSYDLPAGLHGPWIDAVPTATREVDLAVVGGGIAGMSAAVAGVVAGERVVLIEEQPQPGGAVAYFGASEGEEQPEALTHRLNVELAQVEVMTGARAVSLHGTELRVHRAGGVVLITAKRVVLATGAIERLSVFPGNRSPGVTTAFAAWRRAERFGVWTGRRALFSIGANHGYRLAVAAADAGIRVQRAHDVRTQPHSRHIDYAKATGMSLEYGLMPSEVRPVGHGLVGLHAAFASAFDAGGRPREPTWTEQLVVAGGWQPDLGLWHMAGGHSRWNADEARLEPTGDLPNVALAGAAAGFRGTGACLASGRAAVAALLGRQAEPIEDPRVDPAFETPDCPTPVTGRPSSAPAFLDGGDTLAVLPPAPLAVGWLPVRRGPAAAPLAEHAGGLSVSDIAAAVQLGILSPDDAPAIAVERAALPELVQPGPAPAMPLARAWLDGRFGPDAAERIIAAGDPRSFEIGSLIYGGSSPADPLAAIGVVLGPHRGGRARALVGQAGGQLYVRDAGGTVRVKIVEQETAGP